MSCRSEGIIDFYLLAKSVVVAEGFAREIQWQDGIRISALAESDFLREAAWVVLSAGMREEIVRRKFGAISIAFCNWLSAREIVVNAGCCRRAACGIFNHPKKIESILEIARRVEGLGFDVFRSKLDVEGVGFLRSLPYMGPATSCHLAKNIGLDVAKPDRHLTRMSVLAGYNGPEQMCLAISEAVGDRLSVVDLVMWRYATVNPGYRSFLGMCLR